MQVEVCSDKQQWNNFLLQNPRDGLFLQSWEWGEVLKSTGQNVKRLQVMDGGTIVGQVQLVVKKLPFGMNYALAGKGPVFVKNQELGINHRHSGIPPYGGENQGYEVLCDHLKQKKCIFFRFEPNSLILNSKFLILGRKDINPPATLALDITPDENQLLVNMHEKTRYNIRLAEKKGLHVTCEKNFDIFWKLLQKTGQRDDFALHSKESYQAIMSSESIRQIIVWNGDTPVATAGLIGFNDTMYYLYGASDHAYRQMMGPHLVQWEAIRLAKRLGFRKYDFFGIAPRCHSESPSKGVKNLSHQRLDPSVASLSQDDKYEYDLNHRYAGVTRFKLGFGGQVHEEPGTFDLIIDKNKYRVYQVVRKIRSII